MEKFFLAGPRRMAPAVLTQLQAAGVLQIDPLRQAALNAYDFSEEQRDRLKRWEAAATAADHALRLLGAEAAEYRSGARFEGSLEAAETRAARGERMAAALVERQTRLDEEIERIGLYAGVTAALAEAVQGLDRSPRLAVLAVLLEGPSDMAALSRELGAALDHRFLLVPTESGAGRPAAAVVVLRREAEEAKVALGHLGLGELPRWEQTQAMSLEEMASHLSRCAVQVPKEMAESRMVRQELSQTLVPELRGLRSRARSEALRLRALQSTAAGRYGFALFGWVPVDRKPVLTAAVRRFDQRTVTAFETVEPHSSPEEIPVILRNPSWIRPFESLITFLNLPRYDTWDPTWVVALFFPLWFGMIVGDLGYAAVFAGVAFYLSSLARRGRALSIDFFKLRLTPEALTRVVQVMRPLIAWTVVWGFIYGECLGDLLQRLGIFSQPSSPGIIPTLIPRTDTGATSDLLILTSIGFGVFQVLYGFYRKAGMTRRHGSRTHFLEAVGYFGGVSGLVLFGYVFMTNDYRMALIIPTLIGLILFVVCAVLAGMPLMAFELPTQGGHILSYIRIYAVGLASAILANLATDVGFGSYRLLGIAGLPVGLAIGVLLALLIHAGLLILLTVSHLLQPIRLIWVEFFTKVDFYTLSGRPFQPFEIIDPAPRS